MQGILKFQGDILKKGVVRNDTEFFHLSIMERIIIEYVLVVLVFVTRKSGTFDTMGHYTVMHIS